MVAEPIRLQDYTLHLPAGTSLAPLPVEAFVERYQAQAMTAPFHAVVLGDLQPQPPDNLRLGFGPRNEYAAWQVAAGAAAMPGSVWVLSMACGEPLVHVLAPLGAFAEAASVGLVALTEAAFRHQPVCQWVLTALASPISDEAEDTLASLGFEAVHCPSHDPLGRVTFGMRREVCAALHELRA